MAKRIQAVKGPVDIHSLGLILPLSHDAGWHNPARPDRLPEDGFRSYTALMEEFLPALLERGIIEEQVRLITVDNPARAFAF
jgi:predicted metal-dependent phosphotriesterase family hydrolase